MISLILPAKGQISRVTHMLDEEYGTAACIKSRVNRLSVLSAITSVQQRLRLYNKGTCQGVAEISFVLNSYGKKTEPVSGMATVLIKLIH